MSVLDLDILLAEVEGRAPPKPTHPTLAMLQDPGLWPPPLRSRYFVQAEGDVRPLRQLQPALAGRNIGLAANVDAVEGAPWRSRRPALGRLLVDYLVAGQPVYVDSGVYPRWVAGRPLPDFDRVFAFYVSLLDRSRNPDALAVTAPDVIGDRRQTRDLQRRYCHPLQALLKKGVRLVVPVQGRTASELQDSMEEIGGRFPGAWVGVPVRRNDTTPLKALVLALLRLGRVSKSTPPTLPRLHLLGLGGSPRVEIYAARVAVIYRILRGPKIYGLLRERQLEAGGVLARLLAQVESPDEGVVDWLVKAPMSDLLRLAGCVQTRSLFPCPPGGGLLRPGHQSMEGHPAINDNLRILWRELGNDPSAPKLVPFVSLGRGDFWTDRVLGRRDLTVDWYRLVERYSDWDDLCIDAMEVAEQTDPCMVTGAWDADDLAHLVEGVGLGRIEMDAQSVSFAAKSGRWLVGGHQKSAPKWWLDRDKPYRFTWNLLMLAWDRWEREERLRYEYGTSYDAQGFTTTLRARMALAGRPWLLRAITAR